LESDPSNQKPARMHYKFLFIVIGIAVGVAIPVVMHDQESPDKPGPPSHHPKSHD